MIDWQRVIFDLKKQGYSLKKIEQATGVHRNTLNLWKMGRIANPRDFNAQKVRELYCEVYGLAHYDPLPKIAQYKQTEPEL